MRRTTSAAHELRLVGVALQFLTRVPVRLAVFDPEWLHDSARHFPLVGALVGLFGAGVLWVVALFWPAPVAVLLSMAATAWLTGGFHEDGLADTCDGLGGATSRDEALAIMKDSRLGSYGALGLLFTLGLKAAVLSALASDAILLAAASLVLAHAASRACAVALLSALPYGGDAQHAKAKPMAQPTGRIALIVAASWVILLAAALGLALPAQPGFTRLSAALASGVVVTLACAAWFLRRLGGYTGDGLGATQQWTELAIYLALLASPAGIANG
jgi:adenosylcobinamide-GDP ribazoletransferase